MLAPRKRREDMTKHIKVRVGRKTEAKPEKVGEAKQAGPISEPPVTGQAAGELVQCPWCGGMNRVWGDYEVWACSWCGNLFN